MCCKRKIFPMRKEYCCMLVHFYFTLVDYAISYGIMMCLWKIRTGHCYWFGEHLIPCIRRSCYQVEDMFLSPLSSKGSHFQLPTGMEALKQLYFFIASQFFSMPSSFYDCLTFKQYFDQSEQTGDC